MKIVRIDGGLGNQMFCYAFAVALSKASGEEVLIDTHRYAFFPNHNGYELDKLCNVTFREATRKELKLVTRPAYSVLQSRIIGYLPKRKTEITEDFLCFYPSLIDEHPEGYYIGNWQNYLYFDKYREEVLKELSWKEKLEDGNLSLYRSIKNAPNTVSIHIRRGDYLQDPKYCGICELDYYKKAINYVRGQIEGKLHFLIFSNDITWCKDNISPLLGQDDITFVDWNKGLESYNDIRLMSACRANIIANSSFSWWAAYMNARNDKVIIAPDRWINLPIKYRIQMPQWKCI